MVHRSFVMGALVAIVIACEPPPADPSVSVGEDTSLDEPSAPPLETGDVVSRVQRSFLAVGEEHRAAAASWRATIGALGEVAFAAHDHESEAAPLRLRAIVERGATHGSLTAPPRVEEDGALALRRETHTERLRIVGDDLEQTWSFDAEPPGDADLVVRVYASGQRYLTSTETGLHFVDDASGLGTRYGHATWIDAGGERTPVPAHFDAALSAITMIVPTDLAAASRYPAVLDPIVSAEKPLDAPLVGVQTGAQVHPSIAFGGGVHLVVWQDDRFDPKGDVLAARVSSAGVLLDPGGIMLSPLAWSSKDARPSVAFDGTSFFVAFESADGAHPVYPRISYRSVSPSGALGVPVALDFGAPHTEAVNPAIAFGGSHYLIAWEERWLGVPSSIEYVLVSPSGSIVAPTVLPGGGGSEQLPAVAATPSGFLIAWQDFRSGVQWDVYAARVAPTGALLDGGGFAVSAGASDETSPALGSDGTRWLAAWDDSRNGNADIYGARIEATGTVLEPSGIPIATASGRQTAPAIAWSGSRYIVAWHDLRLDPAGDVYATTVLPSGAVMFPSGIAVSSSTNAQANVAVAWGAGSFRLAWDDRRAPPSPKIWSACVTELGAVCEPSGLFVGAAANHQVRPVVAKGTTTYLVVWADDRSGSWDIYGARVDGTGHPAGGSFPISTGAAQAESPAVTFNGTHWLVVWQDDRGGTHDIYGARVSTTGTVLDPTGVVVSGAANAQTDPAIAWNGTNHLVAWTDQRHGTHDIYGARVTTALSVLEPAGIAIATGRVRQAEPAIGSLRGRYLVAWSHGAHPDGVVRGRRIDPSGAFVGSETIITHGADHYREPAIDADDDHFMVAVRSGGTGIDVVRVTPEGFLFDVPPAPLGLPGYHPPAIAFDGWNFLVTAGMQTTDMNVVAMRVASDGTPVDAVTVIAGSSHDETAPAVATVGRDEWMIAYQRRVADVGTGAWRARLRTVEY